MTHWYFSNLSLQDFSLYFIFSHFHILIFVNWTVWLSFNHTMHRKLDKQKIIWGPQLIFAQTSSGGQSGSLWSCRFTLFELWHVDETGFCTCLEKTAMSSLKESEEQTSPPATPLSLGVQVANSHFSKISASRGNNGCLQEEEGEEEEEEEEEEQSAQAAKLWHKFPAVSTLIQKFRLNWKTDI